MDNRILCPYNPEHKIEPLRMPGHLIKCRKNYPDMEYAVCPFNATHEFHKAEMRYHMLHCPNRSLLDREITKEALFAAAHGKEIRPLKGCTDLPSTSKRRPDDDMVDDEWDRDSAFGTFSLFQQQQRNCNDDEKFDDLRSRSYTRRHRDDDSDVKLRRPTTLGTAARLSKVQSMMTPSSASEAYNATPTYLPSSSSQDFVNSSLAIGRGRARLFANFVPRPGASSSTQPSPWGQQSTESPSSSRPLISLARGRGLLAQ